MLQNNISHLYMKIFDLRNPSFLQPPKKWWLWNTNNWFLSVWTWIMSLKCHGKIICSMRGSIRHKQLTTEWSGPYRLYYRKLYHQTTFNTEVDISRDYLLFIRQNMAFKSVFNKHLVPIKMITEGQYQGNDYQTIH
jgi:hypothetical protein